MPLAAQIHGDAANFGIFHCSRDAHQASESKSSAGGYSAVVLGSTGAIGREVCASLIDDEKAWAKVVAVSRRDIDADGWAKAFPRLDADKAGGGRFRVQKVNFDALEGKDFEGFDACFCCLGTTKADAGSDAGRRVVDFDYVVNSANLLKKSPSTKVFSLVSSQGANTTSPFSYCKLKGQVEAKITQIGFQRASIFRPGLLERKELSRTVEKVGKFFVSAISCRLVAEAMLADASRSLGGGSKDGEKTPPVKIYENSDIKKLHADVYGAPPKSGGGCVVC